MRIFRFWQDIALGTPFPASYALIEMREIREDEALFDEIADAIKKTNAHWIMLETTLTPIECSPQTSEHEIANHIRRKK